jgi:hypothetical protein
MSRESAATYYEYHESREELEAPVSEDFTGPWAKCAVCEEFLATTEGLALDGVWFHPECMTDKDRVKAIEAEETEGLLDTDDEEVV